MKCWRCKRRGVDSTMIKDHGYARCPRCGREVRYKISSNGGGIENLGCGTKVLLGGLLILLIILIVASYPWLLLLLIVPFAWLIIHFCRMDDDD